MTSGVGEEPAQDDPSIAAAANPNNESTIPPPGSAPTPHQAKVATHSTYSMLVESDSDLIGHVAYALYKRDKLKFCESIEATRGRAASTQEVEVFIHAAGLSSRIQAYRAAAELLLENFSEEVLEVATQEIQTRYDTRLVQELKQPKSLVRAIFENTTGSLLSIAIIALFAIILYGTRIGFLPLLNDIFGYEPEAPKSQSAVVAPR